MCLSAQNNVATRFQKNEAIYVYLLKKNGACFLYLQRPIYRRFHTFIVLSIVLLRVA